MVLSKTFLLVGPNHEIFIFFKKYIFLIFKIYIICFQNVLFLLCVKLYKNINLKYSRRRIINAWGKIKKFKTTYIIFSKSWSKLSIYVSNLVGVTLSNNGIHMCKQLQSNIKNIF